MARREHKYHFIYKITCTKNGKYYIGMHTTDDINDGYMGGGKRIRNSIRKHGKENHIKEILEYLPDRNSLAIREREIVDPNLLKDPLCMNIALGGKGGFSDEIQKELAKRAGKKLKFLFESDEKYRKIASENLRNLHRAKKIKYDTFKGKSHTSEAKEKMRKADRTGNKNSQFGTVWINNGVTEKKIKSEDLIIHLESEWERGRIKKS